MTVAELRTILDSAPDDVEVIVWVGHVADHDWYERIVGASIDHRSKAEPTPVFVIEVDRVPVPAVR